MKNTALKPHKQDAPMRDSNIELYRIIAMFFIIAHHYVVNSGLMGGSGPILAAPTSSASLFLLVWGAFGKIGINCFVLITGYFMCQSQISTKKFAKLLLEVMFYRLVINSAFWISGYAPFALKSLIKIMIPVTSVAQNFTGTYLIFFLTIPFLNILIHNLNEKQHIRLLLLSLFTYVLFGTIPTFEVTMNYVSWYIVLFFIASYIRLYPKKLFTNKKFWGILSALSVFLCVASVLAGTFVGQKINKNLSFFFVTDSNTFLAVLTGVATFMFFKNITVKPSKIINAVSSTTFGILLIHANSDTMRNWLWGDVLNNVEMYHSSWIYLHAIGSAVAVFVICSIIDLCRIRFVEKPFFKFWDKHWNKVSDKFLALENRLCNQFNINNPQD